MFAVWTMVVQAWGFFETFIWVCEFLFCLRCFRPRRKEIPLFILLSIFYIVLPRVIPDFHRLPLFVIGGTTFGYLIMWVLSMGVMMVGFEIRWNEALFIGIIAHTLQHIWSSVMLLLCNAFQWGYEIHIANVIRFFLADAIMLATYFGLAKYFEVRKKTLTSNYTLLLFSALAQFIINFLFDFVVRYGWVNLGIYLYDIAISMLLLPLLYGVLSQDQSRAESQLLERLITESEAKHRAAMESAEILDRKCHDLKHQIAALRLVPENQREEYIEELEGVVQTFGRLYRTGNDTLDVLLGEKQPLCAERGIELTVVADARGLDHIKAMDLYVLFGNALDNAIEATRQVPPDAGKVILVSIVQKGDITNIAIENPCAQSLVFREGLPVTTKADAENHGYGMKSIRYIVGKYNGVMEASQEGDRFLLDIMFHDLK